MFASLSRLEATSRLPLIAVTADRIKAKERLHRIHARVMLYSDFRFVNNNYAMVVSVPCPPVVEKTSGVNTAYFTSLKLSPYSFFFAFSCCHVECWDLCVSVARCVGWKTLTSKNAFCCLFQKPFALIFTLASSCLLADLGSIVSPVSGCNCGSFSTSVYTSVSHLVVISLISLCLDIDSPL